MSLASTRLSLIHSAVVQRAATTTDSWGNTGGSPVWSNHFSALPCRLWAAAGREAVDAATVTVVEDLRMIVALGTDVTERDRLGDVSYRGTVILPGPTSIRAVLHNADHLELVLVRIA